MELLQDGFLDTPSKHLMAGTRSLGYAAMDLGKTEMKRRQTDLRPPPSSSGFRTTKRTRPAPSEEPVCTFSRN